MRDAQPYLAESRTTDGRTHCAAARRFWSPRGPGTETCIALDDGSDTSIRLTSRFPFAFGRDDLAAELSRSIREHLVSNPCYRGPIR